MSLHDFQMSAEKTGVFKGIVSLQTTNIEPGNWGLKDANYLSRHFWLHLFKA